MSGDLIHFQSVLTKADRARMELERELDDLNERLEEQGGATQAQVSKINKLMLNFFISCSPKKKKGFTRQILTRQTAQHFKCCSIFVPL